MAAIASLWLVCATPAEPKRAAAVGANATCTADPVWLGFPLRQAPALPVPPIFAPAGSAKVDTALAARLDEQLRSGANGAPGASAAVLLDNGALWTGAVGVSTDGIFLAASITKSVTAAIILKLVEEGRLSLRSRLSDFYPELPNASLITIDHLLRNVSGLQLEDPKYDDNVFISRDSDIARLARSAPQFCPGTKWAYSNVGWRLLGGVVEKTTGVSYPEAVEKYVARPLNLTHTFIREPGKDDIRLVPSFQAGKSLGRIEYASAEAAGALASTPAELAIFWRSIINGELISSASRDLMFNPIADMYAPQSIAYGRGAMIFYKPGVPKTAYGHPGGVTGFSTAMYYLAEERAIIVVMINDRTHSSEDLLGKLQAALDD